MATSPYPGTVTTLSTKSIAGDELERLWSLLTGEAIGYQLQQRCRRVDGEAISVLCNTWLATDGRGHRLHLDADGRPR